MSAPGDSTRPFRLAPLLLPLIPLLLISTARSGTQDDAELLKRGIDALPALLASVDSPDADRRLRSRRLATRIVLAHHRAHAPAGMEFVYGPVRVDHRGVHLKGAFYLASREVTRGEFAAFAAATGLKRGRWADGDDAHPVVWISYEEAGAYAKWKKARLPSLEELSNAATSFGRLRFPWGGRFDARFLNSKEGARGSEQSPGSFARGRSPAGIHDLLGNVSEWTTTATGKSKRLRIFGGSFKDLLGRRSAPFVVNRMAATARSADVGFRLALALPRIAPRPPQAPAGVPGDSGSR